jgi:hypothetical protein
MIKDEVKGSGVTGLIPDFFHDIIAYLIPGFTVIALLFLDTYIATREIPFKIKEVNIVAFFFLAVLAYVIGRVFEQIGYKVIHHRRFPFFGEKNKLTGPKWSLVLDKEEKSYTQSFKNNLETKIEEWLEKQAGKELIAECKTSKRDDYFNLIQFYLRERFPIVALYEKKQNAIIVLTRSLCVVFSVNLFFYFIVLFLSVPSEKMAFSPNVLVWIICNAIFSIVFYSRFKLDKKYHAMYIFETFISMKKMLKTKQKKRRT